jgi:hypothetical protein
MSLYRTELPSQGVQSAYTNIILNVDAYSPGLASFCLLTIAAPYLTYRTPEDFEEESRKAFQPYSTQIVSTPQSDTIQVKPAFESYSTQILQPPEQSDTETPTSQPYATQTIPTIAIHPYQSPQKQPFAYSQAVVTTQTYREQAQAIESYVIHARTHEHSATKASSHSTSSSQLSLVYGSSYARGVFLQPKRQNRMLLLLLWANLLLSRSLGFVRLFLFGFRRIPR